jgi:hypothetical protein
MQECVAMLDLLSKQKSLKYQLLRLLPHQLASRKPSRTNGETDATSP